MELMTGEIICECQRCGRLIEFASDLNNTDANCPHCGKETTLIARPGLIKPLAFDKRPPATSEPVSTDKALIKLGYIMAILIPVVSLVVGIYLIAKKETDHGIGIIGLSIFSTIMGMVIISLATH